MDFLQDDVIGMLVASEPGDAVLDIFGFLCILL